MTEAAVARIGGDLRTPHGDREDLAAEREVLFDQNLGVQRHQPQQPFSGG
jgi:hypothetical protein